MNKFFNYVSGPGAVGLLVVRLVFGAGIAMHGWGKIQSPFSWMGPDAPVPGILQALAALSEFGGGLAILFGCLTQLGALGLFFTMAYATFLVHMKAGHPFVDAKGGPSYELAAAYLAVAVLMILTGPGAISIDAILAKIFFKKKSV